jgi:glycosyltransferase involved in cell wall biosynthesis
MAPGNKELDAPHHGEENLNHHLKVAQITAADITVKKLLLPLIDRLTAEGYDVHAVCSEGHYASELRAEGYTIHGIEIERRISPMSNLKSLWRLYRLMRRERFDIVHVHTPVAAVLGRLAAWTARVPIIMYTAHGFYFHDSTPRLRRRVAVLVEKALARMTHVIFTQSYEDSVTAVEEGICDEQRVIWIGNGVDTGRFVPVRDTAAIRDELGLTAQDKVVGFVGRVVAEKGILELVQAMKIVARTVPDAKLVIVGDTLNSDRDRGAKDAIARMLDEYDLSKRVVFAGFLEDIRGVMAAMDVFSLPSYREGMPRTIIEAMASGKPVVATNIRGCREEVLPDSNGLLVPVKDPVALAGAITSLLSRPELARRMGDNGRERACRLFDEKIVLDRQVKAYSQVAGGRPANGRRAEGERAYVG